jgi:sugar lactone lactonase YvrE
MKNMYKTIIVKVFILLSVITISFSSLVYADNDYIVDNDRLVPIPETYEVKKVLINLGEAGKLNRPEDLFLDSKGFLYVADTGNNRILKMNREGKVLEIITGPKDKPFSKPSGVFVDESGNLYVADTENKRILRRSTLGIYDKTYVKPDSNLLSNDFTFDPSKIFLNSTGYMYIQKSSSFIMIDEQNRFRGFVGAKEIGFSFQRMLIRLFATRTQRDRITKVQPVSYSNFMIANDGLIYATVGNTAKGQIRKLNSVGKNLYPDKAYGLNMTDESGKIQHPNFADIAVDENGVITVIDKMSRSVYQYDQEGNMLLMFGAQGERKGRFMIPSSIVVDNEGNLYISDSQTGILQIFEPTNFTKTVLKAVNLYNSGAYEEAMKYWEEVLKIDANYSLAHKGMGRLYYKEERWKEAMEEYKLAEDKDGYSKAFKEYRHEIFRKNFVIVFFSFIGIVTGLYQLILLLIKKSKIITDEFSGKKGVY